MATISTRTSKKGVTTFRVGYYEGGRFRQMPAMLSETGARRIKAIIEDPAQGPDVARRLLEAHADGAEDVPTLAQCLDRYVEARAVRCSEGTLAGYRREAARTFLPRLGQLPVTAIDRPAVQDWIRWQMTQPTARSRAAAERAARAGTPAPSLEPVSPKTVRNAHSLLSSILYLAVQDGLIPTNPAHGQDLPADDVEEEKDIFTRPEWDRFYRAMTPHFQPLLALLITSGARWGEATALQVRDLDVDAGVIHVRRAWKKGAQGVVLGTPKTQRGRRAIMLPDHVVAMLTPLAAGRPPRTSS